MRETFEVGDHDQARGARKEVFHRARAHPLNASSAFLAPNAAARRTKSSALSLLGFYTDVTAKRA